MSVCVKPLDHQGRCRATDGHTWDNTHPASQREADVLAMLPGRPWCLGTTSDGSPRHPSRLARDVELRPW